MGRSGRCRNPGKEPELEKLETEIKKEFYFSVQLPETQSGKICLYLNGTAEYEEEETGELRSLSQWNKAVRQKPPAQSRFSGHKDG